MDGRLVKDEELGTSNQITHDAGVEGIMDMIKVKNDEGTRIETGTELERGRQDKMKWIEL